MTVAQIRTIVNGYAEKSVSDLTVSTLDLTILAMNNARRRAERLHDFTMQDYSVLLDITAASGGVLSDAVIEYEDADFYVPRIKTINTFYLVDLNDSTVRFPLYHHHKKNVAVWTKELNYLDRLRISDRYPGDVVATTYIPQLRVFVMGERVYLDPVQDVTRQVSIDVNLWLPDYDDSVDGLVYTDWFTEQGADYLIWASLIELNKLMLKYAPRAEGYVPEPVKDRDDALQTLIEWDNFRIDQGRQPYAKR